MFISFFILASDNFKIVLFKCHCFLLLLHCRYIIILLCNISSSKLLQDRNIIFYYIKKYLYFLFYNQFSGTTQRCNDF